MPEISPLPFAAESARCRIAQLKWSESTISSRLQAVRNLRHLLVDWADKLTAAVHEDVFRNRDELIGTDLLPTAAAMKFLLGRAGKILKPIRADRAPLWLWGCRDVIHRRPFGVVGIIGTWNYPIYLNVIPIVQSVTAGNGILWKPSEQTPRTAKVLTELFEAAGFPPDLILTLPATREAGPQLAEADVDFVQFTGSDTVGRQLAKRLGERLIPSTLELSGVDACFVLADADPAFAAKAVWYGTSLNAGQTCLAVRRVFVARPIYDAFISALTPYVEAGREVKLVLPSQVEFLTKSIEEARARGCRILRPNPPAPIPEGKGESDPPSPRRGGVSYTTFLLDAPPDLAVFDNVCFTPLAAVTPFDSLDEVVKQHEAGRFGLSASVFTSDARAGAALAAKLSTGSVIVNDVIAPTAHPATPFGGRKASGWGTTQGAEGLLAFTVPQVVTVRSGKFRPHFDSALPTGASVASITRGMLAATHAKGFGARLKGVVGLVKGMMGMGKTP